ncbi:MAG TPA: hypothetical protein VLY63_09835, partial [Anaerolineae bacterium]|nr:hypothetical protein [Anaerolineae bacterium]
SRVFSVDYADYTRHPQFFEAMPQTCSPCFGREAVAPKRLPQDKVYFHFFGIRQILQAAPTD